MSQACVICSPVSQVPRRRGHCALCDVPTERSSRFGPAQGQWFNESVSEPMTSLETGKIRISEADVFARGRLHRADERVALSQGSERKDLVRKRKFARSRILGRYHGGNLGDSSVCIELRIDKIIDGSEGSTALAPG